MTKQKNNKPNPAVNPFPKLWQEKDDQSRGEFLTEGIGFYILVASWTWRPTESKDET